MAFINASDPTREPRQILVLVSDKSHFFRGSYVGNTQSWLAGCARRSV